MLCFPIFADSALVNFGRVTQKIYRGARLTEEAQYKELSKRGVKTIISLETTPLDDPILCEKHGIQCLSFILPLPHPRFGGDQNFDYQTLMRSFFSAVRESNTHPKVYIHCRYGKDRTGALAALITLRRYACRNNTPLEYNEDRLWEKIHEDLLTYDFREEWYPNLLEQIRGRVYQAPPWICDSE